MENLEKEKQIPDEFKQLAKDFADKGFITTSFDNLVSCGSQIKPTTCHQ